MIKKIENYNLPEHTNSLYKEEAISSIGLTHEIAVKINEVVDALNELSKTDLEWKQTQEGIIRKGVLFMKDNLLNSLNDLMVTLRDSGFIDERIEYHFNTIKDNVNLIDTRLDNLLGKVKEGSTSLDAEIIDARIGVGGYWYDNLGEAIREQVGGAITIKTNEVDINTITTAGRYVIGVNNAVNKPDIGSGFILKVENFSPYILQTATTIMNNTQSYYRLGRSDKNEWGEWVTTLDACTDITTSGIDLNTLKASSNYVIGVTDSVNKPPFTSGFILNVECLYPFVVQTATNLSGDYERYYRVGRYDKDNWGEWKKATMSVGSGSMSNEGYHIVNMGDSITDFDTDGTSLSNYIADLTGATTYNCGFGGCRMTPHTTSAYTPFSMCELADAIVSGDFTNQEVVPDNSSWFATRVETLKNIDFNNVDILTIGYGTNDFTASIGLENSGNKLDKNYFAGALRYSIETLLSKYPNLRIVIVAPTWRYWLDDNNDYKEDSDTKTFNGVLLHKFVEKCIEIGKEYHIPVVNPYDEMGINKYNYSIWFRENDGTHPSSNGKKLLAKQIVKTIRNM